LLGLPVFSSVFRILGVTGCDPAFAPEVVPEQGDPFEDPFAFGEEGRQPVVVVECAC